jgi:hypothetical protein
MPDYKRFITTEASDKCSGAVLSFGPSWETPRPVAIDSMTFKNAELNYPVHEKELLAIICALKKWRVDLLGSPFFIYTDHKTLEIFNVQKELSHRQARWMEFMSQFNTKIVYIKGEENTVADALSCLPPPEMLAMAKYSQYFTLLHTLWLDSRWTLVESTLNTTKSNISGSSSQSPDGLHIDSVLTPPNNKKN